MELKEIIKLKSPEDLEELTNRINNFYEGRTIESLTKKPVSPALFRVLIGVNKSTLSRWKTHETRNEWWNLIKTHEEILLGFVAQKSLDPDIKNVLGYFNTLRAFQTELWAIEFRPTKLNEEKEQIVIHTGNTSKKKILGLGVVDGKVKAK